MLRLGVLKSGTARVQTDQVQQALDKAGRLPERHADHDLHRQAGLDGSVPEDRVSPTLACRLRRPRLPVGCAAHVISASNQIVSDPRRLSALL